MPNQNPLEIDGDWEEFPDEDWCRDCGADLDLEGWDGRCGTCADLFERGET